MGRNADLSKETLTHIHTLYKAKYSVKEICEATGVSKRSVQRWTRRCGETKDGGVPTQLKKPGRSYKISDKALNIIRRELKTCPTLSAREIKEKNPQLLGIVSVRTVSRYVKEKLHLPSRVAAPKRAYFRDSHCKCIQVYLDPGSEK